jgi:hypothetical protein
MTCTNCGARLSCGCQQRVAQDGKKVCSNCVATYNRSVVRNNPQTPQSPVINSININK